MEGNVEFSSEAGRVPHPHTGVTERANRRNRIGDIYSLSFVSDCYIML